MGKRWKISYFWFSYGLARTYRPHPYQVFCSVNTVDITSKYKHLIKYVNLPLAVRPVPHYSEIPVPVFTWLFVPVFKESIYNALTRDADVNMDPDFDLADTAMSWSWQSVSSSPEVFKTQNYWLQGLREKTFLTLVQKKVSIIRRAMS